MLATSATEVLTTILYIVIALLALMFMVVIHEFGHYISGKILGFKILEFSIGFGPAIFKKKNKKNGEVFSIRPIPLGGFCQFEDEDAKSDSPTAFNNQKPWKRLIVLFSGAFFNFLSGIIIISFFFTFYGQVLPTVNKVYEDSTNISVLQEGDVFLRVDGHQVNILLAEDATSIFTDTDEQIDVTVLRDGKKVKLTLSKCDYKLGTYDENGVFTPTLDENGQQEYKHGFGFSSYINVVKLNFGMAIARSFSFMFFVVIKILMLLGQLITGKLGLENAGGPITTISVMSEASRGGISMLAYSVSIISANLAVMNLLPLPALDGSRMVFTLIEWIFKKPVPKKIEAVIHTVGLILLFAFAIFADIFHFIKM